jgi:hypothetical protein
VTVKSATPKRSVPPSRRTLCVNCQAEIDSASAGVYQWVSGWMKNRADGGGNAVALIERTKAWSCAACISKLKANVSIDQGELFGHE